MVVVYEFLTFIQNYDQVLMVRNGADVLIREMFNIFGHYSVHVYSISLFLIMIFIAYQNRHLIKNANISFQLLFLMLIESILWSSVLLIIMLFSQKLFLSFSTTSNLFEMISISIGAGIWEELTFRLFGISAITFIFYTLFQYKKSYSTLIALIISSLIFSMFHYLGVYGDIFTWESYSYRSIAGLILGTLYITRGFGISVYTHIFYDIALVGFTMQNPS